MVSSSDGDYIESKRVSFRRLIDGVRVIGNDICDLYFDSNGLYDIEIKFYDYEKTGELDMLTLDEAVAKIKEPDAFVLESATNRNFSGAADKLTVERTKLLFVNRYSDGCEILQPVYNLMGTAENTGGSVEFSARITAVPEKYTHESINKRFKHICPLPMPCKTARMLSYMPVISQTQYYRLFIRKTTAAMQKQQNVCSESRKTTEAFIDESEIRKQSGRMGPPGRAGRPARGAAVRSGQMYIPKPNGCGNERVCDGVHV